MQSVWAAMVAGLLAIVGTGAGSMIPFCGARIGLALGVLAALVGIKHAFGTTVGKALLVWLCNVAVVVVMVLLLPAALKVFAALFTSGAAA